MPAIPTKFLYAPDRTREVRGAESWRLYSARVTVQATSRDKINFHWDEQHACNGATFTTSGDGCRNQPESGAVFGPLGLGGLTLDDVARDRRVSGYPPSRAAAHVAVHGDKSHAVRCRLRRLPVAVRPVGEPGQPTRGLARITEQCAAGCPLNGGIPNLTYRSANWGHSWDAQYTWRASVSYVTGAHNLKIGYGGVALVSDLQNHTNDLNLVYTVNNGTPISLTQTLLPFTTSYRTRNASLYVQDQWTLGRMTLQGALRFDRNWSFSPEQTIPADGLPARRHWCSRKRPESTPTRTSHRAAALPTTCSATARPRSR